MSILIPGTSHQITWSVQNLLDTTTYYVKAVIRDVRTETILATILLTDLGGGRFSNYWNVPQDPTGFGREIEIEKTVYTDSGYTTVSNIYGRWLNRYTVFNIANRLGSTGGYGGHGAQIDYKEIANIVKRQLETLLEPIKNSEKPTIEKSLEIQAIVKTLEMVKDTVVTLSDRISLIEQQSSHHNSKLSELSGNKDILTSVKRQIEDISKSINSPKKIDLGEIKSIIDKQLSSAIKTIEDVTSMERKKLYIDITDAMGTHQKMISKKVEAKEATPTQVPVNKRTESIKRLLSFA